jgi:hypothetical protein
MSQVAGGWHYFRDGLGAESLYDLAGDPVEARNLANTAASARAILACRRSILQVITESLATLGVEPASLWRYRILLKALIPAPQLSEAARPETYRPPIEPGSS